jgi:hypothetical protein
VAAAVKVKQGTEKGKKEEKGEERNTTFLDSGAPILRTSKRKENRTRKMPLLLNVIYVSLHNG